jgi:hypothetical protein
MAEGGSATAELLHRAIAPAQRAPALSNLASPVKNPRWREIDDWGGGRRAAQAGSTIHGRTTPAQPWESLRGGGDSYYISWAQPKPNEPSRSRRVRAGVN